MRKMAILALLVMILSLFCAYKCGIRHAMEDSCVSVYIDGTVEIMLDGEIYEHKAF